MQLIVLNYNVREDVLVIRRFIFILHQPMPLTHGGNPFLEKVVETSLLDQVCRRLVS